MGVHCDWVYNSNLIVRVYSHWVYTAKCFVGVYCDWVYKLLPGAPAYSDWVCNAKCIVGTTHVEDDACCIVGLSGNHDNSDTRVGLQNIAAPFLHMCTLCKNSVRCLPERSLSITFHMTSHSGYNYMHLTLVRELHNMAE